MQAKAETHSTRLCGLFNNFPSRGGDCSKSWKV
jgi:hypothetical protein